MAAKKIACVSCGFEKNPAGSERCVSCGARLELATRGDGQGRDGSTGEGGYQQEGFSMTWLFISLAVQGILTGVVIFGLPKLLTAIDFEGGNGMTVCIPLWFVGGFLVGLISPGRVYVEPVIASFIVALPTTFWLVENQTVRTLPPFLYMIMAAIGILFTLIGSYMGERVQSGPAPKTTS
jgi:hypothetical protein